MPRKLVHTMTDSVLYKTTILLLENRPYCITYAELAEASGVSESWIKALGQGRMHDPSVVKVEKLYNALSAAPLELPYEL